MSGQVSKHVQVNERQNWRKTVRDHFDSDIIFERRTFKTKNFSRKTSSNIKIPSEAHKRDDPSVETFRRKEMSSHSTSLE